MTIEEAVNLIDQVIANFRGTRIEHVKLQEALEVIQDLIDNKSTKKSNG